MHVTLVRGKFVIVKIDRDAQPVILEDAAVLVQDGSVSELGTFSDLVARNPAAKVLGSSRNVISPGFINAHHHVGVTPLQLGSPDLPLELWIVRRIAGRSVDPYLDTMYSAFEMIESGVTTVQHLHGRVTRPVSHAVEVAAQVICAYQDLGMRVSYSFGVRDQNRVVYEPDEHFLRRLPPDLAPKAAEYVAEQSFTLEESLEIFQALYSRYSGDDRVKIQLAPVNLHWCSDAAITATTELARKSRVPMHMHLLETPLQKEYARRRTGTTAVRHLQTLGALGPDMTLGHGVWLTEGDIRLIVESGTRICHNCSSNLRLRSGIAPLNIFRTSGVPVALGIDEAGLNDDRDMLQELRLVLRLHRTPGLNETEVPSCAEVFQMATEYGALTTPFGTRIGTLEPGRAADLVIFDWDQIGSPYLSSDVPLVDALVQRATRGAISSVMIGGEIIFEDGRFVRVSKPEILGELARQLRNPPTAIERRNRDLGISLLDHARRFYDGYVSGDERDPYYKPSSRV